MKRFLVLSLGVVSGLLVARYLRNRRSTEVLADSPLQGLVTAAPPTEVVDNRTADLRRRLEEARSEAGDEEQFVAPGMAAEVVADEDPPADEFEAMRRRVHQEARQAADRMRDPGSAERS